MRNYYSEDVSGFVKLVKYILCRCIIHHISKNTLSFAITCEIGNLKPWGHDQENITLLLLILVAKEKDRLLQIHFSCQQVKQEIFFAYFC